MTNAFYQANKSAIDSLLAEGVLDMDWLNSVSDSEIEEELIELAGK